MKVLVVGGGGREHAIARALSCNSDVRIYAVMAKENPGIASLSEKYLLEKETDIKKVLSFAVKNSIEQAVIGPEAPLESGVVNLLETNGIPCTGPDSGAARLETDKAFCRELMRKHRIDGCPFYRICHGAGDATRFIEDYDGDLAIKPIGLTGGKGVRIMGEHFDSGGACEYVRRIGGEVVLEERLIGEEFTLMAFTDGRTLVPMPLVQDHKRAYEGDVGPNTGGMGSYSMPDHTLPFVDGDTYKKALSIMKEVLTAMAKEGTPYKGIMYGQFMATGDGPRVVEFNARFGDPEAMNVLSLLDSDFTEIISGVSGKTLSGNKVSFSNLASVCKYIVPEGYPENPVQNQPIHIGNQGSALLYYSNVANRNDTLYTQTSRTLAFVGLGENLHEAEEIAEKAASSVEGRVFHRKDIGTGEILEKRIRHMREIS